ncbi:MAG TPA: class I SAM-dependent methyltransferase, partial [Kamptonema sp.]|nr:class I SAM-dependent methyltransferase [Kamptonema sp.]
MDSKEVDLIDKIRQQFDNAPYPANPLEQSPKYDYQLLYIHNFVTAYYLKNKRVVPTEGKVILDAGCGSGYKSLILAEANLGAKIVGVDISEESVKLARQRLQYHGFDNAEFHDISIENLQSLGCEFDYINCDEVLYLLPDMVAGLRAMKSVLKPDGIIRVNLHSSLGRTLFFRAQEALKMMGLMDDNPRELEIDLLRQIMGSLKNEVMLKRGTWDTESAKNDGWLLANFLLLGDKGSTIPEMFAALKAADLEFISMVNWRHWDLLNLFENTEDLPAFIALSLPEASLEERLHLFTLLHPIHRLLDFWCGYPNQDEFLVPSEWALADWQQVRVHLHPQLRTVLAREDLINCIAN